MFGYVVAGAAAVAFGVIAVKEMNKTTGEKVKGGDTVFVNADSLRVANGAVIDTAGADRSLRTFLQGFLNTSVKVVNVRLGSADGIRGAIIGFPFEVAFPPAGVVSIERNGKRIT